MLYVGINLDTRGGDYHWPIDALVVTETLEAAKRRLEEHDDSVRGWQEMGPQSYDHMALRDRGQAIIYEVGARRAPETATDCGQSPAEVDDGD